MSGLPTVNAAVASASKLARAAIEHVMELRGWPTDVALSRAVDRLLELEGSPSTDDFLAAVAAHFGAEVADVARRLVASR